jgi:hypothetical protein
MPSQADGLTWARPTNAVVISPFNPHTHEASGPAITQPQAQQHIT